MLEIIDTGEKEGNDTRADDRGPMLGGDNRVFFPGPTASGGPLVSF